MVRARGIHPLGVPIVASVERCAELLGIEPARLAHAVERARLEPWGLDGARRPVWRWGELIELGQQLGGQLPASLGHSWCQYEAAERGRASRKRKAAEQ